MGRHFRRNLRDVLTRISSKWKRHGAAAYSAAVSMQMMERRASRQPRLDESVSVAAAVAARERERDRRERSPSPRVRMLALAEEQKRQEANQYQQHQHRFVPNSHGAQRSGCGVHFPVRLPARAAADAGLVARTGRRHTRHERRDALQPTHSRPLELRSHRADEAAGRR